MISYIHGNRYSFSPLVIYSHNYTINVIVQLHVHVPWVRKKYIIFTISSIIQLVTAEYMVGFAHFT